MKAFASFLVVLALAAPLSSCAPAFDTPPDLQPLLQAYNNPSAVVGSDIMAAVADEIADAAEGIQDSEFFEEILNVIIEVQEELEASTVATCKGGANDKLSCEVAEDCPDGTCVTDLVLDATCEGGANEGGACASDTDCPGGECGGGVVIPTPNGQINVNYICPGWDEGQFDPDYAADPDPENGKIVLTMTLSSEGIGRVVWGTADNCRYLLPSEQQNFQSSYDGGVALDLGDPVAIGEDIRQLLVTFLVEGTIGFDGRDFRINQSFRIKLADETGLVILVDLAETPLEETFNYIFQGTSQCLRDATAPPESICSFGCDLEDSLCFNESGTLFSW